MFLNCHSYNSLRYGTLPFEMLVAEALKNDVSVMAITDINNTMGTMDFVRECRLNGITPAAGIEFRDTSNRLLYVALARNNRGFQEINEFLTWHNLEKKPLPPYPPPFNQSYVIFPFSGVLPRKLRENERIGVKPGDINRLATSRFRYNQSNLVALLPVTFATDDHFRLHTHLRAIDNNTLLDKIVPEDLALPGERFIPAEFIRIMYEDYPEILRNTEHILKDCRIHVDFNSVKNKHVFSGSRYDDKLLLEKLAYEGLEYRYGKPNAEALKRHRRKIE